MFICFLVCPLQKDFSFRSYNFTFTLLTNHAGFCRKFAQCDQFLSTTAERYRKCSQSHLLLENKLTDPACLFHQSFSLLPIETVAILFTPTERFANPVQCLPNPTHSCTKVVTRAENPPNPAIFNRKLDHFCLDLQKIRRILHTHTKDLTSSVHSTEIVTDPAHTCNKSDKSSGKFDQFCPTYAKN